MIRSLIALFFLARPIMFIEAGYSFGGLNLFELLTILFTLVLALIAAANALRGRGIRLSKIDLAALIFVSWCTAVSLVYPEDADLKSYVQLVLPPLTLLVLKRAITSRAEFLTALRWLLLGFTIPVLWSAVTMLEGEGLAQQVFWTGLERYSGIYKDIHTMAHNMGFVVMVSCIYFVLANSDRVRTKVFSWETLGLLMLSAVALYCATRGQVRTVYVGLFVFFATIIFLRSKRAFAAFVLVAAVVGAALAPLLSTVFFDVTGVFEGQREVAEAGSGRPLIWDHNIAIFSRLPIDRQLAGIGIGHFMADPFSDLQASLKLTIEYAWNSHNDFLEMLMEIGVIGLLTVLILYTAIGLAIRRLERQERPVFFALLLAVVVMNFLSNSYIGRFGLAQMLFMVLIYIELPGAFQLDSYRRWRHLMSSYARTRLRTQSEGRTEPAYQRRSDSRSNSAI